MTTVINNPGGEGGSGMGAILGVIIAIVLIALFFIYGLPALRDNGGSDINVDVTLPTGSGGGAAE